ncbi:endo-1,4-beta-xylanase [Fulvivirga sp. M361]|uniref:glycoside hydrolase n=1 Tax=Fulvivirga sp. M361 TaxID=2594266 RepID=UPI00117A98F6|nr:glycoside hydrolase [Fulvivirga sp. M361]TRX54764.1 endo-1,4-beta-xylanase [Fulvivirga sp. M361]
MPLLTISAEVYGQLIQVHLDPATQFQQIDGFGASDAWRCQFVGEHWPDHKKEKIATLLFSQEFDDEQNPEGIGLSIWRFYVGAGTTEQGANSDIKNEWRRAESFLDKEGNYDWSKQQGQQWFLRKAKEFGVEHFLAFSISAPVFWTLNGKGYNTSSGAALNLQPDRYSDYADFLVSVLKHFEEQNLGFDYLSPVNEPQWDWNKPSQEGTPATNENIYTLTRLLDEKITARSLKTKIVLPEAADLRWLYKSHGKPERGDQANAFFRNDSPFNLGEQHDVMKAVLGHSYFTTWPVDSLISIRQGLNTSLKEQGVDYWQSEFCILEKTDAIGSGHQRDLGMNTALYVARVIHADLTLANARSWQWWTALTIADFKDGLIYLDTGVEGKLFDQDLLKHDGNYHASKLLWVLGNFSRFVRPGMVRVKADLKPAQTLKEQYNDVIISAYADRINSKIVVVAINNATTEKKVNLQSPGVTLGKMFITSESENMGFHKISSETITLSPRSVTTLTGNYGQ